MDVILLLMVNLQSPYNIGEFFLGKLDFRKYWTTMVPPFVPFANKIFHVLYIKNIK